MTDFQCRFEDRGQKRCAVECQSCRIWNETMVDEVVDDENPKIESENPKIASNPKIDFLVYVLSVFCIFYLATRPRPRETTLPLGMFEREPPG